jgi:hypothetical protein
MPRFYQPDISEIIDSPFMRDGADKLIRRSYWLDMDDRTLVMVMTQGIGANLTNEESGRTWRASVGRVSSIRSAFRKYFHPNKAQLMPGDRTRVRCSVSQLCCSVVLVATKRVFGLVTAVQIASASLTVTTADPSTAKSASGYSSGVMSGHWDRGGDVRFAPESGPCTDTR